jgi:hypothetical protein
MPCAIRNLPSCQLSAKQPAPQVKIEINGDKHGEKRTFTTGDLIEGIVTISVTRETDMGHLDITFEGKCLLFIPWPGKSKLNHPLITSRYLHNICQSSSLICARTKKGLA